MTMISFSVSFFSQFLQISISSWRLYQLMVFIAKLWDENLILVMAFLLLKLKKFRYLSSLKSSFVCEKKVVLFIFISVKQGLNATVFSFFFGKTYAFFYIPSYLFHHSTPWYVQDEVRHTVRVQQCLIFVTQPDSLLASSSLKALRKLQSSFRKGILCKYLNNCVSIVILKGNRPSFPNTFELLVLFLTSSICLHGERWNFCILLNLCWSLGSP